MSNKLKSRFVCLLYVAGIITSLEAIQDSEELLSKVKFTEKVEHNGKVIELAYLTNPLYRLPDEKNLKSNGYKVINTWRNWKVRHYGQ